MLGRNGLSGGPSNESRDLTDFQGYSNTLFFFLTTYTNITSKKKEKMKTRIRKNRTNEATNSLVK